MSNKLFKNKKRLRYCFSALCFNRNLKIKKRRKYELNPKRQALLQVNVKINLRFLFNFKFYQTQLIEGWFINFLDCQGMIYKHFFRCILLTPLLCRRICSADYVFQ